MFINLPGNLEIGSLSYFYKFKILELRVMIIDFEIYKKQKMRNIYINDNRQKLNCLRLKKMDIF